MRNRALRLLLSAGVAIAALSVAVGAAAQDGDAGVVAATDERLDPGTITAEVITDPLDATGTFLLRLDTESPEGGFDAVPEGIGFEFEANTSRTYHQQAPGRYLVSLIELPGGFVTRGVTCRDRDDGSLWLRSEPEGGTDDPEYFQRLFFDLGSGQVMDCEFHVERLDPGLGAGVGGEADGESTEPGRTAEPRQSAEPEPTSEPTDDALEDVLAPLPGRWLAEMRTGTVRCGNRAVSLPTKSGRGRVTVGQGGRRVTLVDPGSGIRISVDQVVGKPGIYRGTHRVPYQGRKVPFDYRVVVMDPEHFTTTMTGKFRADGATCRLTSVWDSTFLGE